jgi:hypothetical protein
MIHLTADHPVHGEVPLCGRADWSGLTRSPERNECWECRAIETSWPDESGTVPCSR